MRWRDLCPPTSCWHPETLIQLVNGRWTLSLSYWFSMRRRFCLLWLRAHMCALGHKQRLFAYSCATTFHSTILLVSSRLAQPKVPVSVRAASHCLALGVPNSHRQAQSIHCLASSAVGNVELRPTVGTDYAWSHSKRPLVDIGLQNHA